MRGLYFRLMEIIFVKLFKNKKDMLRMRYINFIKKYFSKKIIFFSNGPYITPT